MHRLFTALAFLLLLAVPAHAEQVVIGTGHPEQDVANMQAAVDQGGSVLLKGNFNFGPEGRVKLTKSIRIRGEADAVGEPRTIISGGTWTLYAPLPYKDAPPADDGPIISIRDLRFEGATGTPLHFPYVGGLDVSGCTVAEVTPMPVKIEWSGGDTLPFQAGIVVGNRIVYTKGALKRAVTGTVRIAGNRFHMDNDKPEATAGYGVLVDWTWGADITVKDNIINNTSRNGIEILDNTLNSKGQGTVSVSGNSITTEDEGIPYPHEYGPNGIVAGWYFDTAGGVDFSRNNRIAVSGNRIEARGETSTGILLYANDMVVTCNDVIMGGGAEARGIVQTGSRGFFANNRVRGKGHYALYCYPFERLVATANTFAWTEMSLFTAIQGQILLGGTVNLVVGKVSMLIDKGKGNHSVETPPCSLPELDPEGDTWEPVGP